MSNYDYRFKVILVGGSGVGKSSILERYVDGSFSKNVLSTIGADFKNKDLHLRKGNKLLNVKLTIWDTAGQERFRTISTSFYRVAQAVILVYDISSRQSFEHVRSWLQDVERNATYPDIVKLLVGNKTDLESQREVSMDEGQNFAKEQGMIFIEVSALTSDGVDQAFEEVTYKILESESLSETGKSIRTGVTDTVSLGNSDVGENHDGGAGFCCFG